MGKLAVIATVWYVVWHTLVERFDESSFVGVALLGLVVWLVLGLGFLALRDQRYRCRVCLRRLRMPVMMGNWSGTLMNHAAVEYICPFGHGKLSMPEVDLTGLPHADWKAYRGFWQEFFAAK